MAAVREIERLRRSPRMIVVGERGINRTVADADGYALAVGVGG